MTPKQVALVQDSFGKVAGHNDPITGQGLSNAAKGCRYRVEYPYFQRRIGTTLTSRRMSMKDGKECAV
jgi:hypothetical protein